MFVIVLFFIAADLAHGQMHDHGLDTFGVVDFPVSCTQASQIQFNGRRPCSTHDVSQARRCFRHSAEHDSGVRWLLGNRDDVISTTLAGHGLARGSPTRMGSCAQEQCRLTSDAAPATLNRCDRSFFSRSKIGATIGNESMHGREGMEKNYVVFPEDHEVAGSMPWRSLPQLLLIKFPSNNARAQHSTPYLKREPRHPGSDALLDSCKRCARPRA